MQPQNLNNSLSLQIRKVNRKVDRERGENTPYPSLLAEGRNVSKDAYANLYHFVALFTDPQDKVVDARIYKTELTLLKLLRTAEKKSQNILNHPLPVVITRDFWDEYRKAKTPQDRLQLLRKFNILTEENIFFINEINIDIDSPFEYSYPILLELIEITGIPQEALSIYRTKSGNLRLKIHTSIVRPDKKNKNGKTNIENAREIVRVINAFFNSRGMKADPTFTRINHPVWLTKKFDTVQEATTEISFYELYRKVKKLQKDQKLYQHQQRDTAKREKRKTYKLPAFICNRLQARQHADEKTAFEKAVETLYENARSKGTYTYFLQPLAGWCKYLDMSYDDFYDIARQYLTLDKKREKDIRTAWKYARELQFNTKARTTKHTREYDYLDYAEKLLDYLEKNGTVDRQTAIKQVFDNQNWLEQVVVDELTKAGVIEAYYQKQEGTKGGRPKKVYRLSQTYFKNTEKSSTSKEMLSKARQMEFRHIIITSPYYIGGSFLVVGWSLKYCPGSAIECRTTELTLHQEKGGNAKRGSLKTALMNVREKMIIQADLPEGVKYLQRKKKAKDIIRVLEQREKKQEEKQDKKQELLGDIAKAMAILDERFRTAKTKQEKDRYVKLYRILHMVQQMKDGVEKELIEKVRPILKGLLNEPKTEPKPAIAINQKTFLRGVENGKEKRRKNTGTSNTNPTTNPTTDPDPATGTG